MSEYLDRFTETEHVPISVSHGDIYQFICDRFLVPPDEYSISIVEIDWTRRLLKLEVVFQKKDTDFYWVSEREVQEHVQYIDWEIFPYRYARAETREELGEFVDVTLNTKGRL